MALLTWTQSPTGMWVGRGNNVVEVYTITGTELRKTGADGVANRIGEYDNVDLAKAAALVDSGSGNVDTYYKT